MPKKELPNTAEHDLKEIPFFSVVTVTFNNYDDLLHTYKSVEIQSYKNFEWIVINGGFKDDTGKFLETLKMDNFNFLSETDKSLFDAMNKGIARAKGEFITFLNSGDIFSEPETLAVIKDKFDTTADKNSIDFIYGDAKEANKDGNEFYRASRSYWRRKMGMFTHHQAMFYRREILTGRSINYDLKYNQAGDYDFTLHFLTYSRSYLYIPISISTFLQGGLSHQNWKQGIKQDDEIRRKYFKMNKLTLTGIYSYQYLLHTFRYKFTPVYNFLRFSGSKK